MRDSVPDEKLLAKLTAEYDAQALTGIFLAGSGARGELSEYSDIDVVLVHKEEIPADLTDYRLLYREQRLISIHRCPFKSLLDSFNSPLSVIKVVQGLRDAKILLDHDGLLAKLQKNAVEFTWSDQLKGQALRAASSELVGNIEELHKLLKGLKTNEPYTLLNGVWGMGMAMPKVMALVHGVLSRGDNAFYKQVHDAVGIDSKWTELHKIVIGAALGELKDIVPQQETEAVTTKQIPLFYQAKAAMELFAETAALCDEHLLPEDKLVVNKALSIAHNSGVI